MSYLLLMIAVLPVIVLGYFIYKKDAHSEPLGVLAKLFGLGVFSCIPVVIVELLLNDIFPTSGFLGVVRLAINVFFGIALVEEGFKWLFTKKFGYDGKDFDEVYDIIVYAVFVSLGFACFENILYVFQYGFSTGVQRALTAVPGHVCDAIAMGYFFAKAKVASVNNNQNLYKKNMFYSILVPTVLHAIYDTLAFGGYVSLFYLFVIVLYCYSFQIVDKVSKIQGNIKNNLNNGNIGKSGNGTIQYNYQNNGQMTNQNVSSQQNRPQQANFCPVCGTASHGSNFCMTCGCKLK